MDCGGRHLPNGDDIILIQAGLLYHLLQILMDPGAVCIKSAAVSLIVVLKIRRLGDQIDHIKPKTADSLFLPVKEHSADFLPNLGILPV